MQAYIDTKHHSIDGFGVFFCGCDFNCPYCNVPELLRFDEEKLVDLKEIKKSIDLSGYDDVIFTGGEPLLQRQALLNLMRYCRKKGLKIILDTNGSKPDSLKSVLMSNLVDEVRMDLKSIFDEKRFERATRSRTFFKPTDEIMKDIKTSIKVLKNYENIDIKFIIPIVPSILYKKEDVLKVVFEASELDCSFVLKRFRQASSHADKKFTEITAPTERFIVSLSDHLEKNAKVIVENEM